MNVEAFKITPTSTFVKVRGLQTEAPHIPLHIIAVIDVSGSMEINNRLTNVKRSLQHVVPLMSAVARSAWSSRRPPGSTSTSTR